MPFPKSYGDLIRSQNTLLPLSIDKELLWVAERVGLFGDNVSDFIKRKETTEAAVLSGNASAGLDLLDGIEDSFGKSFFLTETRLALLQNFKGLDAQKAYLQTIRSAWNRGITPFIAYHVSQRLEFATNPLAFPERFVSVLNRSEIPRGMFEYLLYRVLRHSPPRDHWPVILTWEENASIVDQYETLIAALSSCSKDPHIVAPALSVLRDCISDSRIDRLLVLAGQASLRTTLSANDIQIRERLDADRPEEALTKLLDDPKLSVSSHTIPLEAICRANLSTPIDLTNHPAGTPAYIVDHLVRIIRKDEGYEDFLLNLVRFTDAFATFSMSRVTRLEIFNAVQNLNFDMSEDLVASFVF